MAMLLDKDKVKMLILTEKTTFLPGQHINGALRVEVLKEVSVTAIRLMARAKESISIKVRKGRSSATREQSFVHYEHLITFFGFSKECGRRGGASLAPGVYEYPFDFVVPAGAPPSYHCRTSAGDAELAYILRATVDIPRGFDKKSDVELCVLPAVAAQQFEQLSATARTMDAHGIALAVDPGYCGMHADPKASVTASASVQALMLLQGSNNSVAPDANGGQGGPSANELIVRLSLANTSHRARIRKVRVAFNQHRHLIAEGDTVDAIQEIAATEAVPPGGALIPRASVNMEVRLRLPTSMRYASSMSQSAPLPTMSTPCIQTTNLLTISFPGLGIDALVNFSDVTMLVSAVDSENRVPMIPCFYSMANIHPEDKLGAE